MSRILWIFASIFAFQIAISHVGLRQQSQPSRLTPGPWNAISDVPGVRVGHATIIAGDGPLVVGQGLVADTIYEVADVLLSILRHRLVRDIFGNGFRLAFSFVALLGAICDSGGKGEREQGHAITPSQSPFTYTLLLIITSFMICIRKNSI